MYGNNSRYYGHFMWSQTKLSFQRTCWTYWMTYSSVCQRKYFEDWIFTQITTWVSNMVQFMVLFSKMKKQFDSNKISRSDTKFITGSFSSHPAITDCRYYGHQMTVPRVSAIMRVDCTEELQCNKPLRFIFSEYSKNSIYTTTKSGS